MSLDDIDDEYIIIDSLFYFQLKYLSFGYLKHKC